MTTPSNPTVERLMGLADDFNAEHWIDRRAKARARDALRTELEQLFSGQAVELPERAELRHEWGRSFCNGYNACLDDVAKLGPLYRAPVGQGEAVAWRVVADATIHEFLNSDERDVFYCDIREVPSGTDADGFTITPLYAAPPAQSDEAAMLEWVIEHGASIEGSSLVYYTRGNDGNRVQHRAVIAPNDTPRDAIRAAMRAQRGEG